MAKIWGQLERAQVENVGALPTAGIKGRIVFLTTDNKFYMDNGTSYKLLPYSGDIVNADISSSAAIAYSKLNRSIVTKDSVANLTASECGVILADTTSGAFTLSLPTAVGNTGLWYEFVKTSTDTNKVTIDPDGFESIGGSAGIAVTFQGTGNTVTLANNGLRDGDQVMFTSITDTTGISTNTIYFVIKPAGSNPSTFQLASSLANVTAGTVLPLTTDGSGVMTTHLSKSLVFKDETMKIVSDGTGWKVVSKTMPKVNVIALANSATLVSSATETIMDFSNISLDRYGLITRSTTDHGTLPNANRWAFNVKKNGIVRMNGLFKLNTVGNTDWTENEEVVIDVYINGVKSYIIGSQESLASSTASYDPVFSFAGIIEVVEGDIVQIVLEQSSGVSMAVTATSRVFLEFAEE